MKHWLRPLGCASPVRGPPLSLSVGGLLSSYLPAKPRLPVPNTSHAILVIVGKPFFFLLPSRGELSTV